jgi:hypothetical protein
MFAIRLYISALTLTFFLGTCMTRGIGLLEGIVLTCPLLFMILDMREELQVLRALEVEVSDFLSDLRG